MTAVPAFFSQIDPVDIRIFRDPSGFADCIIEPFSRRDPVQSRCLHSPAHIDAQAIRFFLLSPFFHRIHFPQRPLFRRGRPGKKETETQTETGDDSCGKPFFLFPQIHDKLLS